MKIFYIIFYALRCWIHKS